MFNKVLVVFLIVGLSGCATPEMEVEVVEGVTFSRSTTDKTENWKVYSELSTASTYLDESGIREQVNLAYSSHWERANKALQRFEFEHNLDIDIEPLISFLAPEDVNSQLEKYITHFVAEKVLQEQLDFLKTDQGIAAKKNATTTFLETQSERTSRTGKSAEFRRAITLTQSLVVPLDTSPTGQAERFKSNFRSVIVYASDAAGNERYNSEKFLVTKYRGAVVDFD